MDLSTTYMGLKLANPVIAASSGITGNLESISRLEKNGAAAVVLKSIFEEEILLELNQQLKEAQKDPMIYSGLSETLDYIDVHIKEKNLTGYLDLVRQTKDRVSIPVIGSTTAVGAISSA